MVGTKKMVLTNNKSLIFLFLIILLLCLQAFFVISDPPIIDSGTDLPADTYQDTYQNPDIYPETYSGDQMDNFNTQLDTAGINPDYVSGCDGCTFSGNTLTLSAGAVVDYSGIDQNKDIVVDLSSGGELKLPNGGLITGGTFNSGNPPSVSGSLMEFPQGTSSDLNVKFENSNLVIGNFAEPDLQIVGAKGRIENGKLIIDDGGGELFLKGDEQDKGRYAQNVQIDFSDPDKLIISPVESGKAKFGDDKDNYVEFDGFDDKLTIFKDEAGNLVVDFVPGKKLRTVVGEDTLFSEEKKIIVQGKPTVLFRSPKAEDSRDNSRRVPQIVVINGEEHKFSGDFGFDNGMAYISSTGVNQKNTVDGVHVNPRTNVFVSFDENVIPEGDNYMILGETITLRGKNYVAAFTEREEGETGIISNEFNYIYTEDNDLIDVEEGITPYRLVVDFSKEQAPCEEFYPGCSNGGEVVIDTLNKEVQVLGDVGITNGIYKNHYFLDSDGGQQYNTVLSSCGGQQGVDPTSCSALEYEFRDGGMIDFSKPPEVSRSTGTEQVIFNVGTGNVRVPLPVNLDRDKLYVLGYYGGDWSYKVSEEASEHVLGHVGILLYDEEMGWSVAEASGVGLYRLKPLEESLFKSGVNGKMHTLGLVVDDYGNPVSSAGAVDNLRDIVGRGYGHTGEAIDCAQSTSALMTASEGRYEEIPDVLYTHLSDDEIERVTMVGKMANFVDTDTPSKVLGNTEIIFNHVPTRGELEILKLKQPQGENEIRSEILKSLQEQSRQQVATQDQEGVIETSG